MADQHFGKKTLLLMIIIVGNVNQTIGLTLNGFDDAPFPWDLQEGAKGVQLAELGRQSWAERRWVDVPAL